MSDSRERVLQVKEEIERLKGQVLEFQNHLSDKNMVDVTGRRLPFAEWNRRRQDFKVKYAETLELLRTRKQELRKLSGTSGTDPKWELIKRAYVLISNLDESNVDIGDKGRALLDEIEFHVPMSKLEEAMENDD